MNRKTTTIIVTLAAALLFSTVGMASAVMIDGHNITFINHTYNSTTCNSTWYYNVTSDYHPSLSNWVMSWCNASAVIDYSDENYEYVNSDPKTNITGMKFDTEYSDNESRIVWFTLHGCGDYNEALLNVSIKEGNDNTGDSKVGYGWVTGPADYDNCPGCIVPELSTLILVSVGLLTLVGYFTLRRKD